MDEDTPIVYFFRHVTVPRFVREDGFLTEDIKEAVYFQEEKLADQFMMDYATSDIDMCYMSLTEWTERTK